MLLGIVLLMGLVQARPAPTTLAVGCTVTSDPDARVYQLRRKRQADGGGWMLTMHSRRAGSSAVILPLPDARPEVSATRVTLSYATLNGGRDVEWHVTPSGATLDVHANFELEVNVEPDLDPRVELMNTDGPLTTMTCQIAPEP
jgi:hypothetical protein